MALFLLCPNLGWIQGKFNFYRTFVMLPQRHQAQKSIDRRVTTNYTG